MASYGVLVDLDRCTGCLACEAACKVVHDLPPGVSYLKVIRNKPEEVDGKLVMDHIPMPVALEKCKGCVEREQIPLCAKVCMTKAMVVGELEKVEKLAQVKRAVLFSGA